ncbi:MAG: sigma-70 family RNA polymerase sigma factor [Candidatus Nanopelagicales bacterium]
MPRHAAVTADLEGLLTAAASGDQASWSALVDRFSGLLWSIARSFRLPTAEAADVVQTTWLRLVENLDRIEEPERLASWLATTARRECLHAQRRGRRESPVPADETFSTVADGADPLDAALLADERDAELWRVFELLPERCRRLLRVLAATPAPGYAEVAAALDMPIGSIGPTRSRCLARLRESAMTSPLLADEAAGPADGTTDRHREDGAP